MVFDCAAVPLFMTVFVFIVGTSAAIDAQAAFDLLLARFFWEFVE